MGGRLPPKKGYTQKQIPPPKNGGTTTPENGGTTKPTTKPTKQNININAPAVADAPKSAGKASELDLLLANGVNQATAQDYLQTRKSKLAGTLTQTALNGIIREAKKAGLSLEQALTVCCERSWIGFNAQWLHNTMFGNPSLRAAHHGHSIAYYANDGATQSGLSHHLHDGRTHQPV